MDVRFYNFPNGSRSFQKFAQKFAEICMLPCCYVTMLHISRPCCNNLRPCCNNFRLCCNYISSHVATILVAMLQQISAMLPLYQWPCCNIISDPCWGVCDRMNGSCRRWCDIIKYLLWLILSGHWSSCQDAHTQFYSLLPARLQRPLVVNTNRVDHLSSLTFHMMGIWKKCKTVICHTVW